MITYYFYTSILIKDFIILFRYESIIATLCESLDTLDEPEAKVLVPLQCLCNSHDIMQAYLLIPFFMWTGINDLDNW